jgi:hypothetical protein
MSFRQPQTAGSHLTPVPCNFARPMSFDRDIMKTPAELAAKDVFIGTSSWKYDGWMGQLYRKAKD